MEGEPEDKSRVVLQGLIMRAVGLFPGCCVCVGAGGSRQMLQMKEVLLCVDIVGGKSSRMTSDLCLKRKCFHKICKIGPSSHILIRDICYCIIYFPVICIRAGSQL